jgi:ABC-type nitrate/sulfonate/bicarbonate transport system permease component
MITVAVTAFQTDKVFVGVLIFALSGICVKKLVLAGAPIGS